MTQPENIGHEGDFEDEDSTWNKGGLTNAS